MSDRLPPSSSASASPSPSSSSSSALSPRSSSSRPDRRPLFPPTGTTTPRRVVRPRSTPIPDNVRSRSLFQSYLSLSGNTRIAFGLVLGVVGLAGLMLDRKVLQDNVKEGDQKSLIGVTMVDRPTPPTPIK
ncbi:hypothetical protein IAR55_004833 [Kwoniella newhampshirensis]|uniref:Cytochrome c oxidase assembly factor 3 n=1 Tax=Kwoniella newhampshirensis TaxID=1651941 RepID=A0AAW0YN11_9TREE